MKNSFFQSAIFRIILIIVVLVLPINILTLVLSNTALSTSNEQISREIQSTLEVNATNFEDTLLRAGKRLTYLSFAEADFVSLANANNTASLDETGVLLHNAKKLLNAAKLDYGWIDLFYFYFPETNYMLRAGYPGISFQECGDFIKRFSSGEMEQELNWAVYEIDGVCSLFSFRTWNNADFGIIVNLERLHDRLRLPENTEGRDVFFTNSEGTVFTGHAAAYVENGRLNLEKYEGSKQYEVFKVEIANSNLVLVEVVNWSAEVKNLPNTIIVLQWLSILMAIIVVPLLLIYIRRWVLRPLRRLVSAMDKIEQGDLDYRIKSVKEGREFDQINRSFNEMMEQVKNLRIDIYDKEIERQNIKMRYLSQQIQPHFILNAMNIIYSYEPEEYPLIQKMVFCISKYFRYIVNANSDFVMLRQEMEHIENYFEIQAARFPGLFSSAVEYDSELANALIPPLIVQNFAENAIKHSLQIGSEIHINVSAGYLGEGRENMRIALSDTGSGITDDVLEKITLFEQTGKEQEGLGVGIQNSIERLKYLYSQETKINFAHGDGGRGTTVEIILPVYFEGDTPRKKKEEQA